MSKRVSYPLLNSRYIEFAITKKAPAGPLYGDNLTAEELERNWKFQGTEEDFIVSTGKLRQLITRREVKLHCAVIVPLKILDLAVFLSTPAIL